MIVSLDTIVTCKLLHNFCENSIHDAFRNVHINSHNNMDLRIIYFLPKIEEPANHASFSWWMSQSPFEHPQDRDPSHPRCQYMTFYVGVWPFISNYIISLFQVNR